MKALKIGNTLALAALITSPLAIAAPHIGDVSDNTYIAVGTSTVNAGPHRSGLSGIGINAGGMTSSQIVDIRFLASLDRAPKNLAHDAKAHQLDMTGSSTTPDHSGLGFFTFVPVGDIQNDDIWFGEWSWSGPSGFTDRAVFYVGDKNGVSMPSSGSAVYGVNGLNRFADAGDEFSGTLTAHFGNATLTGKLSNEGAGIDYRIDAGITDSSFAGSASAYVYDENAILATGNSKGEFYGANAAFLAGMATFDNANFDISFGGKRGTITP